MTIPLLRRPQARQQRQAPEPAHRPAGQWTRTLVKGQAHMAYVPDPLPAVPATPYAESLQALRDSATVSIGRLQGLVDGLDESDAIIKHALRREAVASTRIAGYDTSFAELLLFEVDDSPSVSNPGAAAAASTLAAVEHGLARVRGGEPLSQRLLQDLHVDLMRHAKRRRQQAGRYRREAVRVGHCDKAGASSASTVDGGVTTGSADTQGFVPPPPAYIGPCVNELERFAGDDSVPWLTRAMLTFAQLLCIAPFAQANGRLARIALLLLLHSPASGASRGLNALAPSMVFLADWEEAQRRLALVRERGDFEGWLDFVLSCLARSAQTAAACTEQTRALFDRDRARIEWLGRSAGSALRLHALLLAHPVISIPDAARQLDLTQPTVGKSVEHLRGLGMLREMTGRERRRLFAYDEFIKLLEPAATP